MHLLSKTASLEDSISSMQNALQSIEANYSLSHQKHPMEYCYSVNIASQEAPKHIYANGKGSCEKASLASALGEYIERLQTNMFFSDFYLPAMKYFPDQKEINFGDDYLDEYLKTLYDPNDELYDDDMVDFNSDFEDKIVSLPFKEVSTQNITYFPVNLLNTLYVSNGLASGNSPKEAQVQALSEICERYVKIEIIKNGYSLPSYPKEVIVQFEKLYSSIQTLENAGYIVDVLDASFEGKFPVTAISLINPNTSTLFVSFGAHPILEVALERTMTELMQGRDLNNLDDFEIPTFDGSLVNDSSNIESHYIDSNGKLSFEFLSSKKTFKFTAWDYNGSNCDDEYIYLTNLIYSLHKKIYLREYNYLGFYSCQIIVPNFSEVYPIDDLIYNNKNRAKQIRKMILNYQDFDSDEILDAISALEDTIDVGSYIGVIFENPFTLLEFKAHLYLSIKDFEEAKEILQFSSNKLAKIVYEILIMKEQKKKFEDYEDGLNKIFGKDNLLKAYNIVKGKENLINLTFDKTYQNILDLYIKISAKKSF
jgi:ribosomal protein S12 methylthiotransferase accessory factor